MGLIQVFLDACAIDGFDRLDSLSSSEPGLVFLALANGRPLAPARPPALLRREMAAAGVPLLRIGGGVPSDASSNSVTLVRIWLSLTDATAKVLAVGNGGSFFFLMVGLFNKGDSSTTDDSSKTELYRDTAVGSAVTLHISSMADLRRFRSMETSRKSAAVIA